MAQFPDLFSLWANGIMNIISGFQIMTGGHYNGSADRVYSAFPALRGCDIACGLGIVAVGGFAIYTRFQLAGFKMGAPAKLLILYAVNLILPLVYLFLAASIAQVPVGEFLDASSVTSVITSAAMIFINKAYYDKRIELFIY